MAEPGMGRDYWRSLAELHDGGTLSENKAREFMAGVTDDFDPSRLAPMSRKQFLALLTASAAFAAAGCSDYRDKGEIVPYGKKPEEVTPGVANFYASTCTGCAQACGILIKTREGRPIKIDGNPDHPVNRGAICARGQASILNLYDPNRLRSPRRGTGGGAETLTWKAADEEICRALDESTAKGKQIAVVTGAVNSPTARKVLAEFAEKFPTARLYTLETVNDEPRRRGWEISYGSRNPAAIAWEKARVILAIESDFLGTEGNTVEQIRRYAAARDVMHTGKSTRLYAVEGSVSLTGANADYRLRLRPDAHREFLLALLNEICNVRGVAGLDPRLESLVSPVTVARFASDHGLAREILMHLVDDLVEHRGEGIVVGGEMLDEGVQVLVNYVNEVLGNGSLFDAESLAGPLTAPDEWKSLVAEMKRGNVGVVIHAGANPAYHLPHSLGYEESLRSVPVSVSLLEQEDETGRLCTHELPVHHAFESWGDYSVRPGTVSLQQPVISPLYDTRQREGFLLSLARASEYSEKLYHDYLMKRWEEEVYPRFDVRTDFRTFWFSSLHDGVVTENLPSPSLRFRPEALDAVGPRAVSDGYTVVLRRNHFLGDGAFANNGWLQELPHPISKIVWDNYAAIAPGTAAELGVKNDDLLAIGLRGVRVVLPVFVQPGQAERTVSVEVGYGRSEAGPIGTGIGVDVGPLMAIESLTGSRILTGASLEKERGTYRLVSTQEHHELDEGPLAERLKEAHLKRGIIREGTVEEYRARPEFLRREKTDLHSITTEVQYPGVKWAMAIDLNKCVGCNVCVSGCNVENNIPVVGREQVDHGREMQWIRIDRYYSGPGEDPQLSHQPMLCQHCDQAPCENVCPVVATTHSPDGLNQMVYNRCVGTKYCSNNCPFKVRRFNFYNFRDHLADGYYLQEPVSLVHNPEVTVRSRGVMEKCTFCVQRIMEARQHATEQGRALTGSDVRTACQEACPAQAIVFGDMNDPKSEIAQYRAHPLGYHVLEETNVRPNVTYIARLRNIREKTA